MFKEKESVRARVNRLARRLASLDGFEFVKELDVTTSSHPRAQHYLAMAEAAWEEITGDRPDYADCEPVDEDDMVPFLDA